MVDRLTEMRSSNFHLSELEVRVVPPPSVARFWRFADDLGKKYFSPGVPVEFQEKAVGVFLDLAWHAGRWRSRSLPHP